MATVTMSEGWYYLVFGAELGPMSWDDLVQTIARGGLKPHDQVRFGTASEWRPASTIEGLLAAAAASRTVSSSTADDPAASAWYCEIFGAELGPMPWNDLQDMARRGALGPKNRVRPERTPEWIEAEAVPGLIRRAGAPGGDSKPTAQDDETGFEVDTTVPTSRAVNDFEFEVATPTKAAPASDTDFETSTGDQPVTGENTEVDEAPAAPPTAVPAVDDDLALAMLAGRDNQPADRKPETAKTNPKRTGASPVASSPAAAPAPASPPTSASAAAPTASVKKKLDKKKIEKKKPPRERASFEVSAGQKKALAGLVGVCCLAAIGYLGYLAIGSMKSTDYSTILTGYQQLYNEVNTARQNHGAGITPDTQKRFVDALATVRKPLENAEPGSVDDRMYQAGTYLVEMLASAGAEPGSDTDMQYINSEKSYQDLITSVRGDVGN